MNVAQRTRATATPFDVFGIRVSPQVLALAPPLSLFFTTLVILWQYNPLQRSIYQDPAIFAYLSQLVAQGFAPHQYAFNEQASLAFLLGGAAMRVGDVVGLHHLISFRFVSMLVMASVVVLTYVVGRVFTRSRVVGFLAGLMLLGYTGYGIRAATALEPKGVMIVFGLATLYFLYKRQWLGAGACASAAGLAWQIAWGYLIVALLLACVQGGLNLKERACAFGLTLVAALAVFAVYVLYFVLHNAQVEMLEQTFLAPILMHSVTRQSFDARVVKLVRTFYLGFGTHILFGALGALGSVVWLAAHRIPWEWRAFARRARYFLFQNRRTSGTLLVVVGFVVYSFLDFQNYPDWIPLLPFISVFAAWLLWMVCQLGLNRFAPMPNTRRVVVALLALFVLAFSAFHAFTPTSYAGALQRGTWQEQQQLANELNEKVRADEPIWIAGKAELLFFMRRVNLNKYIYLFGNVDAAADALEPGGLSQVVMDAQQQQPVIYGVARVAAKKFSSKANARLVLQPWAKYVPLKRCRLIGHGRFFVRADRAEELFPIGGEGCLKR